MNPVLRMLFAVPALTIGCSTANPMVERRAPAIGMDARSVIPQPVQIAPSGDATPFGLTESTCILFEPQHADHRQLAEFLAGAIAQDTRVHVHLAENSGATTFPGTVIRLVARPPDATLGSEGYELHATAGSVTIAAPTAEGLFRGVTTLRQLLVRRADETRGGISGDAEWRIPAIRIVDYPRFSHRGMLLDCGRHFMTKEFVKRYIDLLAYHKLNVLHWHLTEDQGWRIEIKRYPRLTQVGAWRREAQRQYGGFYTQDDIREIVAYAGRRYVTVIPEIEMPGHSLAALAAYPELSCSGGPFDVGAEWGVFEDVYCAGNDRVFEFLENVLSEVIDLFPSRYVHIGGDECPKTRWKTCRRCQARIQGEHLKDEHELQSYFIRRIDHFLNAKGRRLIGWDEILEGGLAPNATVQSWRGMEGAIAAASSGHDVIASPTSHCYLDYAQGRNPGEPSNMGFLPLEKVYSFEPVPAGLPEGRERHVRGLEGNLWTEHAPQELVDRQAFPRLCAIAEIGWSPRADRSAQFERFVSERLIPHYRRLDALGVTYYIAPPVIEATPHNFVDSASVTIRPGANLPVGVTARYTLEGSEPTLASAEPPWWKTPGAPPLTITDTTRVRARTFLPNGRSSGLAERWLRKFRWHEAVTQTGTNPGVWVEEYHGRWERLPQFRSLIPTRAYAATSDTRPLLSLDAASVSRPENFGAVMKAYLDVPRDGLFTFHLLSDDGSRLWIGNELVVDHDGVHAPSERSGQTMLRAGRHPLRVEYFQAAGERRLMVSWQGPGIEKQPVPATALSHVRP